MNQQTRQKLLDLGYRGTDQEMMQAHMKTVFKGRGPAPVPDTFNTLPKTESEKGGLINKLLNLFNRS